MNKYNLATPFYILAPMDDVTDTTFRQIISDCAKPDLFFTEFVNVEGLQSPGRKKLLQKLKFTKKDQPLIAQLWGKDPNNFYEVSKQIVNGTLAKELNLAPGLNFTGVDLNMGCPQKKEVNTGTCAALINNRPLAKEIIKATKKGLKSKLPISVKTRLGFNEIDMTWIEFLLKQNIDMLTIHGRTKKQKSSVSANWQAIGEVVKLRDKISPKTLIVGNGDVLNKEQGNKLVIKYKLDGIMIGRGIFHDPFVFSGRDIWDELKKTKKLELYKKHVALFNHTWQNNERSIFTLNKYCKIYINGFDGAGVLRSKLMTADNTKELDKLLTLFIN